MDVRIFHTIQKDVLEIFCETKYRSSGDATSPPPNFLHMTFAFLSVIDSVFSVLTLVRKVTSNRKASFRFVVVVRFPACFCPERMNRYVTSRHELHDMTSHDISCAPSRGKRHNLINGSGHFLRNSALELVDRQIGPSDFIRTS